MMIFGIILAVLGGLVLIGYASSILKCRTRVQASIIRFIEKKLPVRGGSRTEYTPVFAYTFHNQQYTAKADMPVKNPRNYFVGQTVTLFIDPNHPEHTRYGSNFFFLCTGLVLAAAGVFTIVLSLM